MAKIIEKIKNFFSTQLVFKSKPRVSAFGGKSEEPKAQREKPQSEQSPEEQKSNPRHKDEDF